MEFRVLGPLEAEVGGQLLPLRGRRQRALLALLLLSANEVVPDDRLIEDLWGDESPSPGAISKQSRSSWRRRLVQEDPELLARALAAFEKLGLDWHAEQTRAALGGRAASTRRTEDSSG